MVLKESGVPLQTGKSLIARHRLTLLGGLLALVPLLASTQANAAPVHFRYVGGHWSHRYHAGWHRYWGGPTIGFYYAPVPVYIVAGYTAPSYYTGPTFWANPSFGLNINIGGGGGGVVYHGGGYHGNGYHGGNHYNGGYHGGVGRPAPRVGAFHGGAARPAPRVSAAHAAPHGGGARGGAPHGGGGARGGDHDRR